MALLTRFIPNFEHLSDEELARQIHCWEYCALVSFRTQRQLAKMHIRHLRDEENRRLAARTLTGSTTQSGSSHETSGRGDARA